MDDNYSATPEYKTDQTTKGDPPIFVNWVAKGNYLAEVKLIKRRKGRKRVSELWEAEGAQNLTLAKKKKKKKKKKTSKYISNIILVV